MEHVTFTEAAALLKVSLKTVYRHVGKGLLVAVDTPQGRRIDRSSVDCHMSKNDNAMGQVTGPGDNAAGTGDNASVPASVHLEALKMVGLLHQEALKAERARMALELQLGQYQRAMAEQAESLAEERAIRQHLEAAAVVPESVTESPAPASSSLESLKTGSAPKRGFRARLGRWLLGESTG